MTTDLEPAPPANSAPVGPAFKSETAKERRFWLSRGAWGLADQVLISATNFITMVLLARGLGPESFGEFVLVYTAMLLANGLQNSLIIQPHHVLGATREGADYRDYTASSALAQSVLAILCALLALLAAGVALGWGWPGAALLLALAPAIAAWQFQEFVRRVLYTEARLGEAFVNDLVSYGGQTLAIALLVYYQQLSGPAG